MMKFNLVHLFVLVSVANFMNAQDMESVLEVGREKSKTICSVASKYRCYGKKSRQNSK